MFGFNLFKFSSIQIHELQCIVGMIKETIFIDFSSNSSSFLQSHHFLENQISHQILKVQFQVLFPVRNNRIGRFHLKY